MLLCLLLYTSVQLALKLLDSRLSLLQAHSKLGKAEKSFNVICQNVTDNHQKSWFVILERIEPHLSNFLLVLNASAYLCNGIHRTSVSER